MAKSKIICSGCMDFAREYLFPPYSMKAIDLRLLFASWCSLILSIAFPNPLSAQSVVFSRPDLQQLSNQSSSLEAARDTQFLALIHARDGEATVLSEFKRLSSFHDSFRLRLERAFSNFVAPDFRTPVQRELKRLDTLQQSLNHSPDLTSKLSLVNAFDYSFPLRLSSRSGGIAPSFGRSGDSQRVDNQRTAEGERVDLRSFVSNERITALNFFQTLSFDTREYLSKYEALFQKIDTQVKVLFPAVNVTTVLDTVPFNFSALADVESIDKMTEQQIDQAINAYRKALQEAKTAIDEIPRVAVDPIRETVSAAVADLTKQITEQYLKLARSIEQLESGIVRTASAIFGNAVGSSSFTYLLIVFSVVFGIIMLFPVLYKKFDSPIAASLLKAEFLLQLSTVFVLTSAILILGIGQFIDKQQLPVLLAGISGYVLGQLGAAKS